MKARAPFLIITAWLASTGSCFADDSDVARTILNPPETTESWVGAGVGFEVELWVQGQFSGAPLFDLPQVGGLVIVKSASRPMISSRRVAGKSWTIQSHEFSAYAQRPGEITIPAFAVRFASKPRFDRPVSEHQLLTDALTLSFSYPAGTRGHSGAIAAVSELRISERWDPELPEALRVGDAVVRTIEQSADDYPAMLLPVPDFPEVAGVTVYSAPPELSDSEERSVRHARRVDALTYVFQQEGSIEIPESQIGYWDTNEEEWRQHSLPARQFGIMTSPLLVDPKTAADAKPRSNPMVLYTALFLLIPALAWLLIRRRRNTPPDKPRAPRRPPLPPLNPV